MLKPLINDIKRGPLANCIVLHDFAEKKPDLKGWFEYTVNFFEENGVVPTKAGGRGVTSRTSKSNITFKNASQRLYQNNFEGIEGIWIGATPHNNLSTDISGSIFSTHLDLKPLKDEREVLLLCFDDQIVLFNKELINKLAADLTAFFKPRYGYCFQREFSKGPSWYPSGICSGIELDDPEGDLLTKWSDVYHMSDGSYKTGDMRDIYPMNILSKTHREHVVEGKPFFEWIKASPGRGELTLLTEDLWAWWVEPMHIPAVRESLRPLGWVIAI